jgi:hypothetical protein
MVVGRSVRFLHAFVLLSVFSSVGWGWNPSYTLHGGYYNPNSRFLVDGQIDEWRRPYFYFARLLNIPVSQFAVNIVDPSVPGFLANSAFNANFGGILQEIIVVRESIERGCSATTGEGRLLAYFLNQYISALYRNAHGGYVSRNELLELAEFLLLFVDIREARLVARYGKEYKRAGSQLSQIALQLIAVANDPLHPNYAHVSVPDYHSRLAIKLAHPTTPVWQSALLALRAAGTERVQPCWNGTIH